MRGSEFSWQDLFWIREGDLVFSNLMAWEKAIAVAAAYDEGTVGDHRMLTCEVDPALATPGFLMTYFRTLEGFTSVVGHSPGTIARNKTLSSKNFQPSKSLCPLWKFSVGSTASKPKRARFKASALTPRRR